jgi:hypothetical protein
MCLRCCGSAGFGRSLICGASGTWRRDCYNVAAGYPCCTTRDLRPLQYARPRAGLADADPVRQAHVRVGCPVGAPRPHRQFCLERAQGLARRRAGLRRGRGRRSRPAPLLPDAPSLLRSSFSIWICRTLGRNGRRVRAQGAPARDQDRRPRGSTGREGRPVSPSRSGRRGTATARFAPALLGKALEAVYMRRGLGRAEAHLAPARRAERPHRGAGGASEPRRHRPPGSRASPRGSARSSPSWAAGASNKEIAQKFDVTERTVKAHLTAVFRKLGISGRLQVALVHARAFPLRPSLLTLERR